MALARLALRNLKQRVSVSGSSSLIGGGEQKQNKWCNNEFIARFSSATSGDKVKSEDQVTTVSEGSKRSPRRRGSRRWLSRNDDGNFLPAPFELFPSGLGNALMQATENINKLFDNMNLTPWSLSVRVKESVDHYKLRYDLPGIPKENVKIAIGDGVLTIKGEHKEEKEGGNDNDNDDDDDEYWSSSSYGYYNTSMVLPDDAKVDEIKAELKDGVLSLTIPRIEKPKKDVKQVIVQ